MKALLVILLLGGSIYGGFSNRPDTARGGSIPQVRTINQLHLESLERQRLERERKVEHVKTILARGDTSQVEKAPLYVDEAAKRGIEYWLLPSISILESSGCRFYPRSTNNCFGYGGTNLVSFGSVDEAIVHITEKLANGYYYKNKSLKEKVRSYNSENINYFNNLIAIAGL